MNAISKSIDNDQYARCISASKRVRWDIDEDVIRGRSFDRSQKYLPDGLSLVHKFATLSGTINASSARSRGAPTPTFSG